MIYWLMYIRNIQKGKENISIFIARCIIYDTFSFLNLGDLRNIKKGKVNISIFIAHCYMTGENPVS